MEFSDELSVNSNALGHIFRSESTGTGSILHAFYGFSGDAGINSITRSGDYFYGTVATGGANSSGSIFRVRTDGTDFKLLLSFPSAETPGSRLLVSGTNIIGITRTFDPFNQVVYRISTDGSGFKLLHGIAALSGVTYAFGGPGLRPSFISAPVSFNGAIYGNLPDINVLFLGIYDGVYRMNPDGSDYRRVAPIAPIGELTVTRDAIYGVTLGTNYPEQVFFKISKADEYSVICRTTNLFSRPQGRFAVIGDSLFGVATFWGNGARVFKLATNGGDLSLLDPLTGSLAGDSTSTSLVATDNAIYGVTQAQAGVNGGAIFQLSTNGLNPAVVWEFPQTRGDAQIDPELIIENGVLYGSTYSGGDAGQGTIFRLDLAPKLNAMVSASRVTVSWPAFAQNYLLQRTERLTAPEWQTVNLPQGATSVTLTNSDGTFFFRLRAP